MAKDGKYELRFDDIKLNKYKSMDLTDCSSEESLDYLKGKLEECHFRILSASKAILNRAKDAGAILSRVGEGSRDRLRLTPRPTGRAVFPHPAVASCLD